MARKKKKPKQARTSSTTTAKAPNPPPDAGPEGVNTAQATEPAILKLSTELLHRILSLVLVSEYGIRLLSEKVQWRNLVSRFDTFLVCKAFYFASVDIFYAYNILRLTRPQGVCDFVREMGSDRLCQVRRLETIVVWYLVRPKRRKWIARVEGGQDAIRELGEALRGLPKLQKATIFVCQRFGRDMDGPDEEEEMALGRYVNQQMRSGLADTMHLVELEFDCTWEWYKPEE